VVERTLQKVSQNSKSCRPISKRDLAGAKIIVSQSGSL
jgi:hypothetical protein